MNIESAQYIDDINHDHIGISVVCDGVTVNLPIQGITWMHLALNEWLAAGNSISPAASP